MLLNTQETRSEHRMVEVFVHITPFVSTAPAGNLCNKHRLTGVIGCSMYIVERSSNSYRSTGLS